MALASLGRSGYSTMIDHMIAMGEYLRQQLKKRHWIIHNDTQLPLICFSPPISDDGKIRSIADRIVKSGKTWLSTVPVRGTLTLRACITSYETRQEDIDCLIELLCKENTRHAI
jgi:glutamate/tyrosine decarboxylase-like PLP-dependent enzyme